MSLHTKSHLCSSIESFQNQGPWQSLTSKVKRFGPKNINLGQSTFTKPPPQTAVVGGKELPVQ